MRIQSVTFNSPKNEWKIQKTDFFPGITLLIGLSGVGKTRILQLLRILKKIGTGLDHADFNVALGAGSTWSLVCTDDSTNIYEWEGEIEPAPPLATPTSSAAKNSSGFTQRISKESLRRNDVTVFERRDDTITLNTAVVPKLNPHLSLLELFSGDDAIDQFNQSLAAIQFFDHGSPRLESVVKFSAKGLEECRAQYVDQESLRNSRMSLERRLCVAFLCVHELFDEIVYDFVSVFPFVSELVFEEATGSSTAKREFHLRFTEHGLSRNHLISAERLSGGMINTLRIIMMSHLLQSGSIILIDEFESSLGPNCLDEATRIIRQNGRHMQFIMTSHHPYVINNIRPENWRIVTREGGVVATHAAEDLGIGKSHHEAFVQLLNSDLYRHGVSVP